MLVVLWWLLQSLYLLSLLVVIGVGTDVWLVSMGSSGGYN